MASLRLPIRCLPALLVLGSCAEGTGPGDPLPGPLTWRLEGDSVRGLQPGDSTLLVAIGEDSTGQAAPGNLAPTWTSSDPSVVAIGDGGWAQGLAPGYALLTATVPSAPPLRVWVGVNASTEALLRVPTWDDHWAAEPLRIALTGGGDRLIAGVLWGQGIVAFSSHLWRVGGDAVIEEADGVSGWRSDVATGADGRAWLATDGPSRVLLGAPEGTWTMVQSGSQASSPGDTRLATHPSGGAWILEVVGAPDALQDELVLHDGTAAAPWPLPASPTLAAGLSRVATDAGGTTYLGGTAGPYPTGALHLARWNDGTGAWVEAALPSEALAAAWNGVRDLEGARDADVAWALVSNFVDANGLLRLTASAVTAVEGPPGPAGYGAALAVRPDGVPYLMLDGRLAWLEEDGWHQHWFEGGWDAGADLVVDGDGIAHVLVRRVGENPNWPDPPSFPVEAAVVTVRP